VTKRSIKGVALVEFPTLIAQWHPTLNGDVTPQCVSVKERTRAWWICPKASDHVWNASLGNRIRGTACPFCAGKRVAASNCLAVNYSKIAAEWHPTKNGTLIPEAVVAGCNRSVWWRCSANELHEWKTSVCARTSHNSGCPHCVKILRGFDPAKALGVTYPTVAAQWHPMKNGELTPESVVFGSNRKVWWKCPVADDHEWQATIISRTEGETGCPYCSGRCPDATTNFAVTYPEIAAQWHPTKNGDLTPDKILPGHNRRVWWQCPVALDHEWRTSPNNRTKSIQMTGCPCCTGQKIIPANCLATTHPEIAAQWHPTKNGRSSPFKLGRGSTKRIWWKCDKCSHAWCKRRSKSAALGGLPMVGRKV